MDKSQIVSLMKKFGCVQLKDKAGVITDTFLTPIGRTNWTYISEPKDPEKPKPKYSTAILFPVGTNLAPLEAAVKALAQATFPGVKKDKLKLPFKKQSDHLPSAEDPDVEAKPGFEAGGIYVDASTLHKPKVYAPNAQSEVTDPALIYSGMWVRAKINLYTYDVDGNKGVSFGLINLQKIADDECLFTPGEFSNGADGYEAVEDDAGSATAGKATAEVNTDW